MIIFFPKQVEVGKITKMFSLKFIGNMSKIKGESKKNIGFESQEIRIFADVRNRFEKGLKVDATLMGLPYRGRTEIVFMCEENSLKG